MDRPHRAVTCVEDLRKLAKRRVPRMFFEYVDCGSWTESTYRANAADLAGIRFRQRVGVDVTTRSLATTIVGENAVMPVALAPTGSAGMIHADGEILAARAAERFGVPFILSTMSISSIEDVAAHVSRPFWFQLYVMKDRNFTERLIRRAWQANCSALVLTLDLPVRGQRHNDIKNGLTVPPKLTLKSLLALASKPRWCLSMMRTKRRSFGNIVGHAAGVSGIFSMADWANQQFDQALSWDDVQWIRRLWDRKLILKGIMDADDARAAIACGADAIVVSNHGGRQLDSAPSSIEVLPGIVEAVGNDVEVLFDGGVRSGQDVLKAMALGAKGVLIGRAFLYGLGAMGEAGVTCCLELIRREMDLTMALCGIRKVEEANPAVLMPART